MRFGVLGPLLVVDGAGTGIPVVAGRTRVLLAALVTRANQVVTAAELAEAIWDGAPPAAASSTVRRYMTRLRRTVGAEVAQRIVTRNHGYLCLAGEDEVDLLAFEALCDQGGAAVHARAWSSAAEHLRAALALWRGTPLQDVSSRVLRDAHVPRLEQLRIQALEWRIEADLHLGHHDHLVPELLALVDEHPLRENAHGQLMLALHRGGRRGEALAAYQNARRVLVAELGVEPDAPLRELHRRILDGDPVLAVATSEPEVVTAVGGRPTPRQLPTAGPHFTGRADALRSLTDLATRTTGARNAVVISAIGGAAGIGKTALALHWSQANADRFPDGQLYANLRGFDPAGTPVDPGTAVLGFLEALGVPSARIPASQDARAALYRSLLAGRRVLVVLDNARDAEQVRPLLPGSSDCLVLITSRGALTGLVAVDGAHPLPLDLLTTAEARELLTRRVGADRAAAEPEAVDELVDLCARLPLALNIAAALVLASPARSLGTLAARLRGGSGRLDALDTGDAAGSVRAVFSWSLRDLDADAARVFRLLGLHPGADLDRHATAALAGLPVDRVDGLIGRLTRAHLLHAHGPDRYGMHDLLRAYARDLVLAQDGVGDRRAASTRLFDHYLHTASAAMDTLFPFERHRRPRVPEPAFPGPPVDEPDAARAWLDTERANLAAVAVQAADGGWHEHPVRLSTTLSRYLAGGVYAEATTIHGSARRAAHHSGDSRAEATAMVSLGTIALRHSRYQQAESLLRQALPLFRELGDRAGEARALHNLGLVLNDQGLDLDAVHHLQEALILFTEVDDQAGEAKAISNLSAIAFDQGRHQEAVDQNQHALDLFRRLGDRTGESHTLIRLGELTSAQGRHEEASGHLRQALALSRDVDDRSGEAVSTDHLGLVLRRQGRPEQAVDHHLRALDLFRAIGHRTGEARALTNLGDLAVERGRPAEASAHYHLALDICREIGHPSGEALALNGLSAVALVPSAGSVQGR
ncbi:AfsR/SARP family transcriptional regulator [Umezawaea tangerina]|uniref:AfsR/SARP family transcriptional regulator n=1 Tax=Umezawaea tangerina TaxID=84725 RepID=UPI001473B79B|nr:BTAD domain-containing putative transcriptional regulator [Umezawaea tangerina]